MRQVRWFPIVYMFLVTAFFSSIVIGVTEFTSERVKANERLAFEKAVLAVLPGDLFSGKDFEYEKTKDGFVLRCQGKDFLKDKIHQYEFKVKK